MASTVAPAVAGAPVVPGGGRSAPRLLWYLIFTYMLGSLAAVAVTFLLIGLGLEFSPGQWLHFLLLACLVIPAYIGPDLYLIRRQIAPISRVLEVLDRGATPDPRDVSRAIVRGLNLPFYSFLRVSLFHGPAAALLTGAGMVAANAAFDSGFTGWQIRGVVAIIFLFASPAHAIAEFFVIAREIVPAVERLWQFCERLDPEDQQRIISIRLQSKLLYLSIFVNSLPLLFFATSVILKVELLLRRLGIPPTTEHMMPLIMWTVGVAFVCIVGTLAMSILTAAEVSRSAARLAEAMRAVEHGHLDDHLRLTSTDEYAELYRGFNLMVASLRDEVQILQISHDLAGELNLDVLLSRLMHATTELLDADRSSLFLYDRKTHELFSRVAEGLEIKEIRIPPDSGIAGAVFTGRHTENIPAPYEDPRFNPEVDRRTGYRTESILAMPIINKRGECIGVTEVLNKRGGRFTARDEARLGAFTAQVAVALENAKLFEDVLNEKNYTAGILRSTSDGMVTTDAAGKVLTANDASLRILGLAREAVVDQPVASVFAGPNAWVVGSLDKVRQSGRREIVVGKELRVGNADLASVNLAVNPLIDVNEEQIGSLIVFEDITSEKKLKSTMARYMSPEVAEQLLAAGEAVLGGKDQEVSILFSDVRNFTGVSEALGARETVSMLNEYFERMVDVVLNHKGVLDKFIGDSVMALFGVPFNGEHDADDAVRAANAMFVALRALNVSRRRQGKSAIDIGVGISTGVVVVGNIGSTRRMEYTVIGDSVNLASRLESATKFYGAKVLLSEYTRRQLTQKALLREIDLIRVKGKTEPVAIYEALDHFTEESFPNLAAALPRYADGIRHYRARQWKDALRCFQEVVELNPHDQPSHLHLERCEHFLESPPSPEWDGVWTMTTK
jgi:adenylate cyclase